MSITSCSAVTRQTFDYNLKTQKIAQISSTRDPGTVVQIENLFQYLPVRRYELLNRAREFLKKIDEQLREYCLIYPRIAFIFKNVREGKVDILLETCGHEGGIWERDWFERIREVLGVRVGEGLKYFKS